MLICVDGCSFELVFDGSILRFFALLASLARGDLLHFCHGGGSAGQLCVCSGEPGRDCWAIIELAISI